MQSVKNYWSVTRAPRYSLTFALPLLLAYEALAAVLSRFAGEQMRNGADVMLRSLFIAAAGSRGPMIFALCLIGVFVWFIARDLRRGGRLEPRLFAWMSAESIALALVFGIVIGTLTARLLTPFATVLAAGSAQPEAGVATRLMLSLGAGLYEELLFRVLLVSGLLLLARRVLGWRPALANTFAVCAGALIFSAFHYIGPYGDPLQLDSFVFRAIAGVAFSALYVFRGFGVTAWTHALYDVLVLVF